MSTEHFEDLERLVSKLVDGQLSKVEANRLEQLLQASPRAVLRYQELLDNHEALCAIYPGDIYESSLHSESETASEAKGRSMQWTLMAIVETAAAIALVASIYFWQLGIEPQIATLTSISGSARWTTGGDQVEDNLQSGHALTGGMLESLSVDSWAVLEFLDGSTVTISGLSELTISDDGQKTLRLRAGDLSATVETQPEGRPMLLQTQLPS